MRSQSSKIVIQFKRCMKPAKQKVLSNHYTSTINRANKNLRSAGWLLMFVVHTTCAISVWEAGNPVKWGKVDVCTTTNRYYGSTLTWNVFFLLLRDELSSLHFPVPPGLCCQWIHLAVGYLIITNLLLLFSRGSHNWITLLSFLSDGISDPKLWD